MRPEQGPKLLNPLDLRAQLDGLARPHQLDAESYAAAYRARPEYKNGDPKEQFEKDAILNIHEARGRRVRAVFAELGCRLYEEPDKGLIVRLGRVPEVVQTCFLVHDDVDDLSSWRRGVKTANTSIAEEHERQGWHGDSSHYGESQARTAAIEFLEEAKETLRNLSGVEIETKEQLQAELSSIIQETGRGQRLDNRSAAIGNASIETIQQIAELKTARYTVLGPLTLGMILAGAKPEELEAIKPFGKHAGIAFQYTNDLDILLPITDEKEKDPADDIRANKQTLLIFYALNSPNLKPYDRELLEDNLGNRELTEVKAIIGILYKCGAVDKAKAEIKRHSEIAIKSLDGANKGQWRPEIVNLLRSMAAVLAQKDV